MALFFLFQRYFRIFCNFCNILKYLQCIWRSKKWPFAVWNFLCGLSPSSLCCCRRKNSAPVIGFQQNTRVWMLCTCTVQTNNKVGQSLKHCCGSAQSGCGSASKNLFYKFKFCIFLNGLSYLKAYCKLPLLKFQIYIFI